METRPEPRAGLPGTRFERRAERFWCVRLCEVRLMLGFIRKLWRRHKVKAADRRIYLDQGHSLGHATGDAQRIVTEHSAEHRVL